MLHSGARHEHSPTSGRMGCIFPTVSGVPNASQRGTKSDVVHKLADWLHTLCRLRGPQRIIAGDEIRCGPQVGGLAP